MGQDYKGQAKCIVVECVVKSLKMAVLLLPVHSLIDQAQLHSQDYPILLIIGRNQ